MPKNDPITLLFARIVQTAVAPISTKPASPLFSGIVERLFSGFVPNNYSLPNTTNPAPTTSLSHLDVNRLGCVVSGGGLLDVAPPWDVDADLLEDLLARERAVAEFVRIWP